MDGSIVDVGLSAMTLVGPSAASYKVVGRVNLDTGRPEGKEHQGNGLLFALDQPIEESLLSFLLRIRSLNLKINFSSRNIKINYPSAYRSDSGSSCFKAVGPLSVVIEEIVERQQIVRHSETNYNLIKRSCLSETKQDHRQYLLQL